LPTGKFRKGHSIILELHGAGVVTEEESTVLHIRKGKVWLDNGPGNDPTGPFGPDGRYEEFSMPGFTMRIKEKI
jgi:hypothetical protein